MSICVGLVVEDLPEARAWMVEVLSEVFPGMVVTQAGALAEGLAWARARTEAQRTNEAALALVDLGLPDGSGIDLIRELAAHPAVIPVVTTIYDDDDHLFEAIAAGAGGYLLKDQTTEAFSSALRRIEQGDPPLSPAVARKMMAHFRRPTAQIDGQSALTPRETEVLSLLGRGLRVAEAARVLSLSEHTISDHVKSIYRKLNIASRAEAAVEAVRRGLV